MEILPEIDRALARKGLTDAAASKMAVGHPSLVKNFRAPKAGEKRYNLNALAKLAKVLDLELYFGPPRDSTTKAAAAQAAPLASPVVPDVGADRPVVCESDLSLPMLRFLAEAPDGLLSTADLIGRLEALFKPTGSDAEIGPGRADTGFSQKVRNIVSHRDSANNPIKKGWIDYDAAARGLRITKAGRAVLDSFTFGPAGDG